LQQIKTLLKLYAKEQYILMVNQQQGDFEVFVSFKVCIQNIFLDIQARFNQIKIPLQVEATSVSVLRSVWQTYWLHENWDSSDDVFHQLTQSILQMEDRFEDFIQQLSRAGWDTDQITLRVPKEITIDESGLV
jgi:hypothetical protein